MADMMVSCARCGVEGERGEQPGEGRIVHGGGESRLGPWALDLLCDDCASALMSPAMSNCTCAHYSTDEVYSERCALAGHRQIAGGGEVTDEDLRALRAEAQAAGDGEQVRLCTAALPGSVGVSPHDRAEARSACERVIMAARAQA